MRKCLSSIALPYGLPVLVVCVFYWKALFLGDLFLANEISGSDMMMQSYPARAELAEALHQGRLPLWTDDLFLGFPVAAEGQVGTFYPLNLLFFFVLPAHWAYSHLMILHVMLAGLFTALFARFLGRSRPAAALAGIVFSLSGFMVAHLKHVNLEASAIWVPLMFWLAARGSQRVSSWRSGIWLGVPLALTILAGHVHTAYNALLLVAVYLLGQGAASAIRDRSWTPARRGVLVAAIMVIVGLGLSTLQILPTYEYARLGTRSGGLDFAQATEYAYTLEDLATYVAPYHFGDPGHGTYVREDVPRIFWENSGYIGILPLILALLGAVVCWRERHVKGMVALAILSILIALGRGSPVFWFFFHAVPGFDNFRFPQRFLLFATLALAVLGAFGLDALADRLRSFRRPVYAGAILVCLADLFLFGYTHNPTLPAGEWLAEPEAARLLKRDPSRFRVWSPDAHVLHLQAYRAAAGWKGDLTPYLEQRNALQPNMNGIYGIQSAGVYFPMVPTLFLEPTTGLDLPPPALWRMLDVYNVKYLLVGRDISDSHFALKARVAGGIRIYENLGVLPRARIVPEGISATSPEHARVLLTDPGFDPETTVALQAWDGRGGGGSVEGSSVREILRRPGRVELAASLTGPGFLVLSDAYYPGWEARVDGERQEILQANVCCRAVALESGDHRVEFRYRPRSLRIGLVISLVTLGVLLVLGGRELARKRAKGRVGERASG